MPNIPLRFLVALPLSLGLIHCTGATEAGTSSWGGSGGGSPPGGWGATPGGVKDIGYAREVIRSGGVPDPLSISTEGLFSEHDLPPEDNAPECTDLLCMRPVLGIALDLRTHRYQHYILMGMASGLSQFQRPPLDVVAVMDRSNSMSIDMTETTAALSALVDHLGPQDRVAVLAFNQTVEELHALGAVTDKQALKNRINGVTAQGGFDFLPAVERGYQIARSVPASPDRLRRVMVFTCGFPDIQRDLSDPFSTLVRAHGDQRIGTSVFGVLLGWETGLNNLMGTTPGASAHYLGSLDAVRSVFDTDFDFMVTPIAYNMHLELEVEAPFTVDQFYGVPGAGDGAPGSGMDVATVFISRSRGGMLARLNRDPNATSGAAGQIHFSYDAETALGVPGGAPVTVEVAFPPSLPDTGPAFYQSRGIRIAVALSNQAELMRDAITAHTAGGTPAARATLTELATHLRAEAEAIPAPSLVAEAELVETLERNMSR